MSATAPRATGELVGGGVAAVLSTVAYVAWRGGSARWASALPGHALGIIGMALMVWAGFAYTWRKRRVAPGDSSMGGAMQGHIIAGLVGPYLVILHSGFAFHGVAGVLTLLMVLVVASGVMGRAVFTAVPRQIGLADPVRAALLEAEEARLEAAMADLSRAQARAGAGAGAGEEGGAAMPASPDAQRDALRAELVSVRHEQEHLRGEWRVRGASARWRRVLSVWWFLHVPVSMALWVLALAHAGGALYYATLSR
ncbi:MAG: hypothetical protein IPN47_09310 [Gemmatimonadetes bacterium]|nr:hypothetical protein [Gemmatimonadota bacterium]